MISVKKFETLLSLAQTEAPILSAHHDRVLYCLGGRLKIPSQSAKRQTAFLFTQL